MKYLLNILLMLAILSCKAQTIVVPLDSNQGFERNPNYYLKDVNNEFDKFDGTWLYQNGNTEITFKLKKEEHYQTSTTSNYLDLLVGEYQYIENGEEKANTLFSFGSPSISGYEHKISGRVLKHRLPSYCTDNSDVTEIKIMVKINHPLEEYTEGRIFLRYVNDSGVEKLQVCIYDDTTMGDIPNARIDIPDGYYEFVKQN